MELLYKFIRPDGVEVVTIESILSIRTKVSQDGNSVTIFITYDGDRRESINTTKEQADDFIKYVIACYVSSHEE